LPPTHISKYDGETNLDHWLEDYHLAVKARGSDDDFVVQYLSLLLSQSELGSSSLSPAASAARAISHAVFISHF
jgi:hypothetical protein